MAELTVSRTQTTGNEGTYGIRRKPQQYPVPAKGSENLEAVLQQIPKTYAEEVAPP